MIGLTLGSVAFAGFELPGAISLGGRQAMSVHRLPGGGRVIDTLGQDDGDIEWAGVLTGADASARAQVLDGMRASGSVLPLQWDQFTFLVVLSSLHLSYRGPWWIPYRARCTVVTDASSGSPAPSISVLSAITGDLAAAGALFGLDPSVSAAMGAAGALTGGTLANATAMRALEGAATSVAAGVASGEAGMGASTTLGALAASAGAMADAVAAQAYVGRAFDNLQGVGG